MGFLYINSRGTPWRKHSYSAGNDYDQSPYKYFLRRILGWREKENKARFLFGRALEEAIQFYHDHNGVGAVDDFIGRWSIYKDRKDLVYTAVESDWETLNLDGQEMVRLYQIRQPSLPIPMGSRVVFQKLMSREVFPGDPNYGEINDEGKLDIIAYADPDHPLLPRVEWRPEYGIYRPVIVDIKTSGTDFPEQPGIAAFDKQLRRYSWLSGIRDVALLGFKKAGRSLKKGSGITLLEDSRNFKAGEEAVIAAVDEDNIWIVKNDFMIEEMDRQGDGKTKAGRAARIEWLRQWGVLSRVSAITRQRLQFISGLVSLESANDAGAIAARQIVSIVNSWKTKSWPQTFGIRYPTDDRNDPYFRAFVLEDENYRNEHFTKSAEENFDDLLEDPEAE
jgi:hypothetical protein